jgi:protein tyrosine/serine phosphatase
MTQRLPGIDNFRDFGGCPLPDGRRVRPGILFRSAHLHFAQEDTAAALRGVGITHVFDLRSSAERATQPCSPHLSGIVRLIDTGENTARIAAPDASVDGALYMAGQYRTMQFEAHHIAVFRRFFDELAEGPKGVLIHCAAGKDRTGLLAAFTLHMLGTDMADIKADYLLTNRRCIKEKVAQTLDYLEGQLGYRPSEDVAERMLIANVDWLDGAFDELARRCGSVDLCLEDLLGVTAERRSAIIAHVTETVSS